MSNFSNILTFLKQYPKLDKIDANLVRLISFTKCSKFERMNVIIMLQLLGIIQYSNKGEYVFQYNGKRYPFSLFSSFNLQIHDRISLKSKDQSDDGLNRTLKLACSMDLINPRVAIGNSTTGLFHPIILYQDKGIETVLDYYYNLKMKKDDYYEIFKFQEINVVSKLELYHIYRFLEEFAFTTSISIWELLLFSKEILSEFSSTKKLDFLNPQYDCQGVNNYWYSILGNHNDCLYFQEEDYDGAKYEALREELDDFTKQPNVEKEHISYDEKKQMYSLKAKRFGLSNFRLLSDIVSVLEAKEELLSDKRKGHCHENSQSLAYCFIEELKKNDSIYIVAGKVKCNEVDYIHHSWIELDDTNIVVDYNHNLIMKKDQFYKLYEAVAISKTEATDMKENIEPLICEFDFSFHPFFLNYFGQEIARDLKKNEKILLKK